MAGVLQDLGNQIMVNDMVGLTGANSVIDWIFHLYDNDYTPTRPDVVGSFHEAIFSGYVSLAVTVWDAAVRLDLGDWVTRANMLEFVCDADGPEDDIFGWYATTAGGVLVAAGRFTAAIPVIVLGDTVTLSPSIELTS